MIRGIRRMVQEPRRRCIEILQQLAAAEAAMNRVSVAVLTHHVRECTRARPGRRGTVEATRRAGGHFRPLRALRPIHRSLLDLNVRNCCEIEPVSRLGVCDDHQANGSRADWRADAQAVTAAQVAESRRPRGKSSTSRAGARRRDRRRGDGRHGQAVPAGQDQQQG